MRSYVPAFDLRCPSTLDEALALFADPPGRWKPLAGGTDLMVQLEAGRLEHREYVSLWSIDGLRGIEVSDEQVTLGALTTYSHVREHPVLASEFPLLGRAAAETGGLANQNRGTLAGNIANASPAADTPPALLVYDAELELASARGTRRVAYAGFHTGYKQMDLAADEIIRAIHLRRPPAFTAQYYRKVGPRRAQAISKVCVAGGLRLADGVVTAAALAFGSVAPTVIRARRAEAAIAGRPLDAGAVEDATEALSADLTPIDDLRSTAAYRRFVSGNLLAEFLRAAAGSAV